MAIFGPRSRESSLTETVDDSLTPSVASSDLNLSNVFAPALSTVLISSFDNTRSRVAAMDALAEPVIAPSARPGCRRGSV